MLERFSKGNGSPSLWLVKVNCDSTGKAAGTCHKQGESLQSLTNT